MHSCSLHLDIINGQIWVQQNNTELAILRWSRYANGHELVKLGIPKEDIVLGFQAPYLRQYTEFGVANR